jgi:hypothetical protein
MSMVIVGGERGQHGHMICSTMLPLAIEMVEWTEPTFLRSSSSNRLWPLDIGVFRRAIYQPWVCALRVCLTIKDQKF